MLRNTIPLVKKKGEVIMTDETKKDEKTEKKDTAAKKAKGPSVPTRSEGL